MITYNVSCDGGKEPHDYCDQSVLNVELKDVRDWKIDRRDGAALCPEHNHIEIARQLSKPALPDYPTQRGVAK